MVWTATCLGRSTLRLCSNGETNNDFPGFLRGRDNAFEGAYIDDIIIGFAERGEMLTGADTNDQFTAVDPLPAEEILVGDYQMEFRLSSFYGSASSVPDSDADSDRGL